MDTSRLRAFVTTAELGSIAAAAERLGFAPSSVSEQLAALEREVGAALFVRQSRGMRLTDAGSRALGFARAALTAQRDLRASVRHPETALRIGTLDTLATEFLPTLRADDAVVTVLPRTRLWQLLDDDELDVVVAYEACGGDEDRPSAVVGSDKMMFVAAPGRRPSGDGTETLLATEPGCTYRALLEQHAHLVSPAWTISVVAQNLSVLRQLAIKGRGVALLPELAVHDQLDSGELVASDVDLPLVGIRAYWGGSRDPQHPGVRSLVGAAG